MTFRIILPRAAVSLIALGLLTLVSHPALALTPKSPEVKATVKAAVEYLKTANAGRPGGDALVGYTLLKCDVPPSHPAIAKAISVVQRDVNQSKLRWNELYTPAVYLAFLTELDSERYAPEIRKLVSFFSASARPYGAWGYPQGRGHDGTADTSMTQYALLGLWEADQAGFEISPRVVESAVLWLSKTQDPGGGFGYQGIIPTGSSSTRQNRVSVSLTTAGLGATYMAQDILHLLRSQKKEDDGLPSALTKVSDKADQAKRSSLSPQLFLGMQGRAAGWIGQNYRGFDIGIYKHYFFYSYERYCSLRELGKRSAFDDWYTPIAQELIRTQGKNGGWTGHNGVAIETSFAVLFLIRSMKKSIEKDRTFGDGSLVGGRGLPSDSEMIEIRNGKVVSATEPTALEKLLANVGSDDTDAYTQAIGAASELHPGEAKALVSQQAAKLRELAGGTSPDKRLVAVQALARGGGMDDVPTLIYVLTDPEREIVLAARDGLRRISRKVHGFKMPNDFDKSDLIGAVDAWKEWYLAVRPDAEFEN